jgi:hypothetical protein
MEVGSDGLHARYANISRQQAVKAFYPSTLSKGNGGAKGCHLLFGMHASVGARCASQPYGVSQHNAEGAFHMILHAATLRLALPTLERPANVLQVEAVQDGRF